MAEILHKIEIAAPRDKVFAAVTTQPGLAGWWTTDTTASPVVGAINEFGADHRRIFQRMRIDALEPGRVFWTCIGGPEEWIGTTVEFALAEENGKTVLRFSHRGWKEASEYYRRCNTIWGYLMYSLKAYAETGKGTPVA